MSVDLLILIYITITCSVCLGSMFIQEIVPDKFDFVWPFVNMLIWPLRLVILTYKGGLHLINHLWLAIKKEINNV